jgi:thymidylate kinase
VFWDAALRRPVRLDVVDRLAVGRHHELRLDGADDVLRDAIVVDGWPRPAPADEQWLALLHGLLDRSRWRAVDAARLVDWVGGHDGTVPGQLPRPVVEALDDAVRRADWPALQGQRDQVVRALSERDPAGTRRRRLARRLLRSTTKLQRALLRPGCRIAVLGPDGAGKSSTIAELLARGIVADCVYLGVAPASAARRRRVPGLTLALVSLRLARGWLRATAQRRRGRSVALDRHPLEATIGPPTTKVTTRIRRAILSHLLPRPDVAVVLMAPAEVLWQRKPEHSLDEVRARRERYLQLADRRGFAVVDTTASVDEVVDAIRRIAVEAGAAA